MSDALAVVDPKPMMLSEDQLALAKRTVFPDSTNDEFALFLHECQRRGIHPLDRMLYPQKRKGKVVFVASIDWFRSKAEGSGELAGNDDPVPSYDEGNRLTACSVTVWRIVKGVRCPFTATARWAEYFPGEEQGFMWKKMPVLMLGKCAEALALRKAFPSLLAGAYTHDEMAQADAPAPVKDYSAVTIQPGTVKPAALPPPPAAPVSTEIPAPVPYQMKPPVARAAAKTKADLEKQMEAAMNKDAPAVEPPKVKAPPTPAKGTWGTYYVILHCPPEGKGPHKMKLHTAPSASREEGLYPCSLWAAPKDVTAAVASRRVKIIEYAKQNGVAIKCCIEEGKPYNDKPQWTITDVQEPEAPAGEEPAPDHENLF